MLTRAFSIFTALTLATPVLADFQVSFRDGAPKDRFTLSNVGDCATAPMMVTIDLAGSPSKLIFDISAEGAGVEVFQPFELVSGADSVLSASDVMDGDTVLTLDLGPVPADGDVAFTIDLDDTVGTREITVSGSEIEGASVTLTSGAGDTMMSATSPFNANGVALVGTPDCAS